MSLSLLLIIILIVLLLGSGPWAGWHNFGYGPSGILGVVLVVVLVLLLVGKI